MMKIILKIRKTLTTRNFLKLMKNKGEQVYLFTTITDVYKVVLDIHAPLTQVFTVFLPMFMIRMHIIGNYYNVLTSEQFFLII